jgi:hypothetical protein
MQPREHRGWHPLGEPTPPAAMRKWLMWQPPEHPETFLKMIPNNLSRIEALLMSAHSQNKPFLSTTGLIPICPFSFETAHLALGGMTKQASIEELTVEP